MPAAAFLAAIQKHSFWTIFAVAAIVRITQVFTTIPPPGSGYDELEKVAKSLALHGTFADPYAISTGSTAHVAPGYTAFLSLIYMVFGVGLQGEQAKRAVSGIVSSLQYALLPRIGDALRLPPWAGTAAGLISALAPYKSFAETGEASWEQPYLALALLLLFLHTLRSWRDLRPRMRWSLLTGFYWSVATYISPISGVVFAAILLYEIVAFRRIQSVLVTVLVFGILQVPWMARNWNQLHGVVALRSNFGLEFHLSNRPESSALMEDNVSNGFITRFHPSQNVAAALAVQSKGEVTYNREELRAGLGWVAEHPNQFANLTFERFWKFWLYPSHRWKSTLATTLITLIGLVGIWRMPAGPALRLVNIFLLSYPLIYYVIQVDRRYRYPIEWIFIVPAIYVIGEIARRVRRH
ncbi:MAG: hypothetical protein EXQ56_14100 [Acidobacteria bacterium]|nr:hypothetical protein [Acidobacteriota bacterium]